jgi:hypothetical protein
MSPSFLSGFLLLLALLHLPGSLSAAARLFSFDLQ